jgi:hypothetical protein
MLRIKQSRTLPRSNVISSALHKARMSAMQAFRTFGSGVGTCADAVAVKMANIDNAPTPPRTMQSLPNLVYRLN